MHEISSEDLVQNLLLISTAVNLITISNQAF